MLVGGRFLSLEEAGEGVVVKRALSSYAQPLDFILHAHEQLIWRSSTYKPQLFLRAQQVKKERVTAWELWYLCATALI